MKVPAEARVDLGAIGDNVGLLRERARGAEVMAMVKAEAYGHGLVEAARAALAGGASWLGVAKLAEGLRLRDAGVTARTLVCIGVPGEPFAEAVARDLDLAVGAVWLLDEVVRAAERAGRPARIHLKADTGMSRGGAMPGADWDALVGAALKAEAAGHVRLVGVMSHLACADEPGHPSIARQVGTFTDLVEQAEKAGARFEVRHLANSAAALTVPEARFDLVRPGIATYGLTPVPSLGTFGLRPAMTLVAAAALVKRVPAHSGVSYGHTYRTDRETTLAVVPVGYGDGIPRHGSNVLEVLAGGRRRRIAGRVCMDQFVIDLGGDRLPAGEEIILFGPGDGDEPTAQEWADALGTISYEIVTRIGSRVPRTYRGPGL